MAPPTPVWGAAMASSPIAEPTIPTPLLDGVEMPPGFTIVLAIKRFFDFVNNLIQPAADPIMELTPESALDHLDGFCDWLHPIMVHIGEATIIFLILVAISERLLLRHRFAIPPGEEPPTGGPTYIYLPPDRDDIHGPEIGHSRTSSSVSSASSLSSAPPARRVLCVVRFGSGGDDDDDRSPPRNRREMRQRQLGRGRGRRRQQGRQRRGEAPIQIIEFPRDGQTRAAELPARPTRITAIEEEGKMIWIVAYDDDQTD